MKRKFIPLFVLFVLLLSSFVQKGNRKKNKHLPKYFVEIPGGYFWDQLHNNGLNIWVNPNPVKDSTTTFYISETEVTNQQYGRYLSSLKSNNKIDAYHKALPDTNCWGDIFSKPEPFIQYYFRHYAYVNFPVVGITKSQAMSYCKWLSDSLSKQNYDFTISVNLPTRSQWIRAARGESKDQFYAMNVVGLRNYKGVYLYNHHVVGEQNIYKDDKSKQYMVVPRRSLTSDKIGDTRLITAEVKSYWPNKFGTYNMCGNVAELILDDSIALGGSWNDPGFDIRIESEKQATEPSSLIGFRVIAYINLH